MKKNKLIEYLRWSLLALFVLSVSIAAYLHQVLGGAKAPSIHALCPFGGLESLYSFFTTGGFIEKIFSGTMILFAITLVIALIFRRSFCGLICPFGAIQEFFAKIGQVIFKKKFIMPKKIDKPLRYLKYVILAITVFYAFKTAGLWMSPYDPWSAYAHLPEGLSSVWSESAVGLVILIITVVGSLVYDRFFCKYLCPMGAFYAIVGKFSPHRVVRDEKKCIDCGICNKKCPVNIDVQHLKEVKSSECLSCQICVLNCPKEGALKLKQGKHTISPLITIIIVIALFFGSIFAFQAAGIYKLTPDAFNTGESIKYDEIKGYMTIEEAAKATKTELKDFYSTFKIPENVPKEVKMKEIKNISPEYDLDAVKESFK